MMGQCQVHVVDIITGPSSLIDEACPLVGLVLLVSFTGARGEPEGSKDATGTGVMPSLHVT